MIKLLKEYIDQVRGVTYSSGESSKIFKEGFLPILRSNNIDEGSINFHDLVYVPQEKISSIQLLKKGDILLTASTGSFKVIGKNGQIESDYNGSFGAFCKVIRPKDTINSKYLKYFFQTSYYRTTIRNVINGANINNIKIEHIDNLNIPLPLLETQKKISTILDKADELRQNDKKILEKYDQLAQSVFLEMFGDPVTNPKGWERCTLGDLAKDIKYGTNSKSFDFPEKNAIAVLRIPNINLGKVNYQDLKYSVIEPKEFNKLCLRKGDLLFVRSNGNPDYIGRCAMYDSDSEAVYASYLIRVRISNLSVIRPDFIAYHVNFKTFRSRVIKEARTTAGNYNLNTQGLKSFELILPPIHLQNRFSNIVDQIETQKQLTQQSLQKSEELFQSLLQRAFRGELELTGN